MSKVKINPFYSGAEISECGRYRYHLLRRWDRPGMSLGTVVFLMLNPSTADAKEDDATIRKCVGFANTWGYDGISVINLFGIRSRDPKVLVERADDDLLGPDYDRNLYLAIVRAPLVVAAWGCADTLRRLAVLSQRPAKVLARIREINPQIEIQCLGRSKDGSPRHPLMLAYTTPLEPFEAAV
jgi:hypothetical protein